MDIVMDGSKRSNDRKKIEKIEKLREICKSNEWGTKEKEWAEGKDGCACYHL